MAVMVVVERSDDWSRPLPGVELVHAREYLTNPEYSSRRGVKLFNLCRSYRYQSLGYYVSLLAAARGHRPLPSVATIQDLKSRPLIRLVSEDLDDLIQKSLAPLASDSFILSIYFGQNMAKRYRRLALQLFNLFPSPMLRAQFRKGEEGWELQSLRPVASKDVSWTHWDFVFEAAHRYFEGRWSSGTRKVTWRYDLAILVNAAENDPPSDKRAIDRFVKAATDLGFRTELIGRDDIGRLAEFDALFIRETTQVNHHTYRFARRAAAEGLVVIDDPDSILRCTNKVYLAELLQRAHVPTPRTVVMHRDNLAVVAETLGFPCILKVPDGSFSIGVVQVKDVEELKARGGEFLEDSDLLIAQEFMPTDFDWRVGILDRKILYVSRYHMARGHWQIIKRDGERSTRYGRVDTIRPEDAPPTVLRTALRAANLIGDGLYGVDLKQKGKRVTVIEVNDNPSLDSGCEDKVLGKDLYRRIMQVILDRIEARKGIGGQR